MPGDITFDSGTSYFGANLTAFVENGTIPASRLDDMGKLGHFSPRNSYELRPATRILASWYYLHQDATSYPTTNFDAFNPDKESTNERIDVQDDHYTVVRQIGAASIVLLKNVNGALPLKKPRSLVMIGSDAGPGMAGPNEFSDQVIKTQSSNLSNSDAQYTGWI